MSAEPVKVLTDHLEPTTSNQQKEIAAAGDMNVAGMGKDLIDAREDVRSLDALMEIHSSRTGQPLSMAGLKDVQALADTNGADVVLRVYEHWLKNRDLNGLKCPLTMFAKEFAGALAALQAQEKWRANHSVNIRRWQNPKLHVPRGENVWKS